MSDVYMIRKIIKCDKYFEQDVEDFTLKINISKNYFLWKYKGSKHEKMFKQLIICQIICMVFERKQKEKV